jgi:formate dehydrogenase subunit delta
MSAAGDARLVTMANQIAGFFRPYPAAQGIAGVRRHLQDFWTPAMRAALAERVARDAAGIDPLVVAALDPHAGVLQSA